MSGYFSLKETIGNLNTDENNFERNSKLTNNPLVAFKNAISNIY